MWLDWEKGVAVEFFFTFFFFPYRIKTLPILCPVISLEEWAVVLFVQIWKLKVLRVSGGVFHSLGKVGPFRGTGRKVVAQIRLLMNSKGGKFLRTGPREIIDKLKCDGKIKVNLSLFALFAPATWSGSGREGTQIRCSFCVGTKMLVAFVWSGRMRLVAIRAVFRSIIIKVTPYSAQDVPSQNEPQNFGQCFETYPAPGRWCNKPWNHKNIVIWQWLPFVVPWAGGTFTTKLIQIRF